MADDEQDLFWASTTLNTNDGFTKVARKRKISLYSSEEWEKVQQFLARFTRIQNLASGVKQPEVIASYKAGWSFCGVHTEQNEFREDTAHEYAYFMIQGNRWNDQIVMSRKIDE